MTHYGKACRDITRGTALLDHGNPARQEEARHPVKPLSWGGPRTWDKTGLAPEWGTALWSKQGRPAHRPWSTWDLKEVPLDASWEGC